MRHYVVGSLMIASAAFLLPTPAQALSTTVNCPGQTIAGALNAGFDEITVSGTCTENLNIRQDDITIQGDGNDTLVGQLWIEDEGTGQVVEGVRP